MTVETLESKKERTPVLDPVATLLSHADPGTYLKVLEEMFEHWLTHERTDDLSARERAERFYAYKHLRKFLIQLNQAPVVSENVV